MRTPRPADAQQDMWDIVDQLKERATVRPSQATVDQPQEISGEGYLRIVAADLTTIGYLGPDGIQFIRDWLLKDLNDAVVVKPDPAGGLALPSIPLTLHRTRSTNWPTCTNATYESIFEATVPKAAPRLSFDISHVGDAVSTAGDWQVLVNGVAVSGIGGSVTTTETHLTNQLFTVAGSLGASTKVEFQARRTAGAGNVRIEIKNLRWRES